jgi:hypothetical protein
MLYKSKAIMKSFKQRDISLENIFLDAVADENESNNGGGADE